MKIYCLRNEFISNAARYTLTTVLENLGYFFEWTDQPEKLDPAALLLIYSRLPLEHSFPQTVIHIPQIIDFRSLSEQPVEWTEMTIADSKIPVLSKSLAASTGTDSLSFDLPANVYYHLARIEEAGFEHPDEVDKKAEQSILFSYQKFRLPIADILMDRLDDLIRNKIIDCKQLLLKKAAYPAAEKFGLALTHDVDFVRAYHPLKKLVLKTLVRLGLKKNLTIKKIEQNEQDYWAFDRLLKHYAKRQLRATFYFIARYREDRHWRYRVKSRKLKRLFSKLNHAGHEIGLHPSRYSFEKPGNYLKEKTILEKAAGTKLSGIRHHYLRCLFPQMWQRLKEIRLGYDAGMVYHNYSGFRAGTCRPFQTFDHKKQAALNVVEFPTAFFEKTLPASGTDKKAAREIVTELISTAKKHHGLLTSLWHTNNLYRPEIYPSFWHEFTNLIQQEKAFTAPLSDQLKWIDQRRDIRILSEKDNGSQKIITLELPGGLRRFALSRSTDSVNIEVLTPNAKMVFKNNDLLFETDGTVSTIKLLCRTKNES